MIVKKKKGNTLLLLLVMILMITVMGGTITTAIAYTTKQNINSEHDEDLLYAAESGIEYAISKIKGDGNVNYTINSIPSLVYKKVANVKVIIGNKISDIVQLESVATSTTGKIKTVKAKVSYSAPVSPPGVANILYNSFITSDAIDLGATTGSISMGGTNITVPNTGNAIYPPTGISVNKPNTVVTPVGPINFNSQVRYKPDLNFTSIKGATNSLNSVGVALTGDDITGSPTGVADGKGDIEATSGVGKFSVTKPTYFPIDVYFVNTNTLTINYPGTTGAVEGKFVIVCSGDVVINLPAAQTILFDQVTIYAKSVKVVTASSLTISTPILGRPADIPNAANYVNGDNILFLDKLLRLYSTNYGVTPGPGGGGGPGGSGSTTITLINGSYQYE